jgi:tripartite-type tricarboxylate transporter receptor subunit TctC
LRQPIVVENRPGANGNLGAAAVAAGDADGYTLVHSTVAMLAVNTILYPSATFVPLRDLSTVATTATLPNVLVVNPQTTDVSSVGDLIRHAKQKRSGLTFATFGSGSSPHILGSLFLKLGGIDAVPVAYRGSAPALTDVLAGRVDFLFDSVTTSAPQIDAGKIRALAVTAPKRLPQLASVPTMDEAGYPGFDLSFWFSLQTPAATPPAVVSRLQKALIEVTSLDSFSEQLRARGAQPLVVASENLKDFVASAVERWAAVARDIDLKPL